MNKKSKTKYTAKRPAPVRQSDFARLVDVSHTAISNLVKKNVIRPNKKTKRFNPILARVAIRAQILQGLQVKMRLDFTIDKDGKCHPAPDEQSPPVENSKPASEWPDADALFTDEEKAADKLKPDVSEVQSSFDYDKEPKNTAEAQRRKLIIDADMNLLKLREKQGTLFDPNKYLPDFQDVLAGRDKGIRDKLLESIEQTTAYISHETDPKKVRVIQTKIIHGVLNDLVTLKIIDYLPADLVERIRAAGLDDSLGVVG